MSNSAATSTIPAGSTAQGVQLTSKSKNDQIGKNEFLTMLITQLRNQDPESPVDSKDFAVQLAQFTQVEKLGAIEAAMVSQSQASSMGALASYLGHRVVLNGSDVDVRGGDGGQLHLALARDTADVKAQFINSSGKVVGEKSLGPLNAGRQTVSLEGLTVPDGIYAVKVVATNRFGGGTFEPTANAVGLVTGFIPGPNPRLLMGSREISMNDVVEVALNNSVA